MKKILRFLRHSFISVLLVLAVVAVAGNAAFAAQENQSVNETYLAGSGVTIPTITARAHVQKLGWISSSNGVIGTTGRALRLEAIQLSVSGVSGLGIKYRAHVQGIGWQPYVADGVTAGTQGQAKRLEAVQIELTGENADNYDIYYRVHVQGLGWLAWAKNGAKAGTEGYSKRLESIEMRIVPKDSSFDAGTGSSFNLKQTISMQAHVQSYGWMSAVESGQTAGVTGQAKRMEAIRLTPVGYDMNIEYSVHVQSIGWTGYVKNGATAGTTGRSLRIEAIKIKLSGNEASDYDVYYRAYVQSYGWLDWAKNDEVAGTSGIKKRMEALQVVLVPKGQEAPGSTTMPYLCSKDVSYRSNVQGRGFQEYVGNGNTSGTTGQGLSIMQFQATAAANDGLGLTYSVYENGGWSGWYGDDECAGLEDKQIEAIKIKLTGDNAGYYKVYYRVHSASLGWLDWASDGAEAGSTEISKGMQAIQVCIYPASAGAPGSTATPFRNTLNVEHATQAQLYARAKLNQVGWDLRAAFNYAASLSYYGGVSVPASGQHLEGYARYGFENGRGNCYVMAAVFCQMARELGYECYLVEGYVPKKGGGITVHGWTEIVVNGRTYVCDPDFTHETSKNGYMITYGTSGTWVYQKYSRVN